MLRVGSKALSGFSIHPDHSADTESEHDQEQSNNPDHIARLREFQFKILSSSNNPICSPSQPRSGRRHTLCLTR